MKKILFIILSIVSTLLNAQQLPISNEHLINKFALNPAFAGINQNIESYIGYRQNWIGIEGAPRTQFFNISGRLTEDMTNMGFGASVVNEQTGNFKHFYADFTYAYHIMLSDEMSLSFGLTPKLYRNQIDLAKIKSFGNGPDPLLQGNSALVGTSYDLGVNILLASKAFCFGLNVPRTLAMKVNYPSTDGGQASTFAISRLITASGSYNIEGIDKMVIEPTVIARYSMPSGSINYAASVFVKYDYRLWGALTYNAGNIIGVSGGAALGDRIVLNYTYELGMGGITSKSSGTHEITIGFLIRTPKERVEPTIFPLVELVEPKEPKKKTDDVQKKLDVLDKKFAKQVDSCKKRIKDLEDKLKGKELADDKKDADMWQKGVVLQNIRFGNNSDKMFSSSFPELNKIVTKMKAEPETMVKITGYTDNIGSAQYNLKLSERRAKAVRDYLIEKGIEDKRVLSEGKGDANPIGDNTSDVGRAMNRRIEAAWKK